MSTRGSGSRSPSSHAQASPFEKEFPGASESANQCARAMIRTAEAVLALHHEAMRSYGLSAAARQALAVLDGAGEAISPTTISERMFVTTASTTSLLDTLEKRGLVTRETDPVDRRRQLVAITPEGRRIVDSFLPQLVALQTAMMEGISEPERARFLKTLQAIRDGLAAVDVDAVTGSAPRRGQH